MNPSSHVVDPTAFLDSTVAWQVDPEDGGWLRAPLGDDFAYLRINNFPDDNMYSLWIGDGEFVELEELAPKWSCTKALKWPATARCRDPNSDSRLQE